MDTLPHSLPRFIPTLTEVIEPITLHVEHQADTRDALIDSITLKLSAAIERKLSIHVQNFMLSMRHDLREDVRLALLQIDTTDLERYKSK